MRYSHTQTAPLSLLLFLLSLAFLVGGWLTPVPIAQYSLCAAAVLTFFVSLCFGTLIITDAGDWLQVEFGPLPIFHRQVDYKKIKTVSQSRTTLLDGWGIHLSLGGGWVWNLWGFDCVLIEFQNGGRLKLGTDDPQGLCQFLKSMIEGEP